MRISVSAKEIVSANILKVVAGTNCPQGGDAGHGGRTLFRLTDLASTAMSVRVNGDELREANSVEIILCGDCECETFIEALEHAVAVLRTQYGTTRENIPL